jgi:hypothetical protein
MVADVMARLSVCKRAKKNFDTQRFNLNKLNVAEVKEQLLVNI